MDKIVVKVKLWNFGDEIDANKGRIKEEEIRKWEGEAVVDTGATMLVISEKLSNQLGLLRGRNVKVTYGNGKSEEKNVATGIRVEIMGRDGTFDALIEPEGKEILIGQIVLERLDLIADSKKGVLRPRPESPDIPLIEVY